MEVTMPLVVCTRECPEIILGREILLLFTYTKEIMYIHTFTELAVADFTAITQLYQ